MSGPPPTPMSEKGAIAATPPGLKVVYATTCTGFMGCLVATIVLLATRDCSMHCVVDPCQFEGSMAYFPHNISRELLDIIRIDRDIMHPNGCNECPVAGWEPVWIAPGDACKLEALGPLVARQPDGDRVLDHCVHNPDDNEEFDDDGDWEDDFSPESHFKACLSISQINYLWEAGLCHDSNRTNATGMPFIGKQGLLYCGKTGADECKSYPCDSLFRA